MISYFFLGWIMLLSSSNEHFQDSFVRNHAKKATIIQWVHLWIIGIYMFFIKPLLLTSVTLFGYTTSLNIIPFLNVSTHDIVMWGLFWSLIFQITIGSYRAYQWKEVEWDVWLKNSWFMNLWITMKQIDTTSQVSSIIDEREKGLIISSYLPFIGLFTAANYPSIHTKTGAKLWSIVLILFLLTQLLFWIGNIFSMIILISYIAWVVFIGISLFLLESVLEFPIIQKIPSSLEADDMFRAFMVYISDFIRIIFWREKKLLFQTYLENEKKRREEITWKIQSDALFLPVWLIYVPIINLLFLPTFFQRKHTPWFFSIGQGITITLLHIFFGWYFGVGNPFQTLLLFPVFLGLIAIKDHNQSPLPIVYSCVLFFHTITFWIFHTKGILVEYNATKNNEKYTYEIHSEEKMTEIKRDENNDSVSTLWIQSDTGDVIPWIQELPVISSLVWEENENPHQPESTPSDQDTPIASKGSSFLQWNNIHTIPLDK